MVELQPSKLDVAGSRPVSRSTLDGSEYLAHLAQLAEHVLGKDEVTRSIRVVGSQGKRPAEKQIETRATSPREGLNGRIGRWRKRNSYETNRT